MLRRASESENAIARDFQLMRSADAATGAPEANRFLRRDCIAPPCRGKLRSGGVAQRLILPGRVASRLAL